MRRVRQDFVIVDTIRPQRLNRADDSGVKVSRFRGIAPQRVGEVTFTAEIVILLLERLPNFISLSRPNPKTSCRTIIVMSSCVVRCVSRVSVSSAAIWRFSEALTSHFIGVTSCDKLRIGQGFYPAAEVAPFVKAVVSAGMVDVLKNGVIQLDSRALII